MRWSRSSSWVESTARTICRKRWQQRRNLVVPISEQPFIYWAPDWHNQESLSRASLPSWHLAAAGGNHNPWRPQANAG